jgi:hypothetical protein
MSELLPMLVWNNGVSIGGGTFEQYQAKSSRVDFPFRVGCHRKAVNGISLGKHSQMSQTAKWCVQTIALWGYWTTV